MSDPFLAAVLIGSLVAFFAAIVAYIRVTDTDTDTDGDSDTRPIPTQPAPDSPPPAVHRRRADKALITTTPTQPIVTILSAGLAAGHAR